MNIQPIVILGFCALLASCQPDIGAGQNAAGPKPISAQEKQQQAMAATRAAAVTNCTKAAPALTDQARADMKAKKPDKAIQDIQRCALLIPSLAALRDEASALHINLAKESQAAQKLQDAKLKKSQGVSIGMSKADVLASSWGKPRKINTTTTAGRVREQWVYGGGYIYFVNGEVTAVQH